MKRFWRDVTIEQGGVVALDGKPVRTPARVPLALPFPALAEAIAVEWRDVEGEIDPRAMPLTGLANAAIDRIAPDPTSFAKGLAVFGESDLLCYRADAPPDLVVRQAALWEPLLAWGRGRYDVHFTVATGIMHQPQPAATILRLGEAIAARTAWELAGLAPIVTISGSLVAALALIENAIDLEALWQASELDEEWQAEQWGRDDLSLAARDARRRDMTAAARFLTLISAGGG